jgi:DNA polymerase-3 subunit epsilon
MRQIILDTETTGLSPKEGHRLIEIGCLEMINRQLTGHNFHMYLNPERAVDEGAFNVHGISEAFLQDKPLFRDVVDDLLAYLGDAELIIHNAPFDLGFINAELMRLKKRVRVEQNCSILDTLVLAKQKHPGQKNNLDALCKRYGVNNTNRALHGALLDAELLAFVYLAMTGGQINLFAGENAPDHVMSTSLTQSTNFTLNSHSPVLYASELECQVHAEFVTWIADKVRSS